MNVAGASFPFFYFIHKMWWYTFIGCSTPLYRVCIPIRIRSEFCGAPFFLLCTNKNTNLYYIWTRHATYVNESCYVHTYILWCFLLSFVPQSKRKESLPIYECVISQRLMNHLTYVNESCHTYQRVISRSSLSCVTYMNVSHYTCTWVCKYKRWGRSGCEHSLTQHTYKHSCTYKYT